MMERNDIFPTLNSLSNQEDLAYFIYLQELRPTDAPDHSAKMWDRRAEQWQKERINKRKGDARVVSALTYLEQRGLLQENYDIADIGCGSGRFAAEFAKRVHSVVGLDISQKMVEHGMEHIKNEGLSNAVLLTCDFQSLDIEKEGYKGAFDLVFSSMTPAIHGMNGLLKSMEMSRGWCCHITQVSGRNHLNEQLMREVFGKNTASQWTGRWFYSLFNVLFLMGYDPETSYETRHQEVWTEPDEEYVVFLLTHMLPEEALTRENVARVSDWLSAHRNEEGLIQKVSDTTYGRILWDVRRKTERPDYRSMKQGG